MTEKITESIDIPVYKVDYLKKAIEKINRKAVKMGCDPLVLTFDNPHIYETKEDPFTGHRLVNPIVIEMITATLEYIIPMIEGYELVAKLDIFSGDDGNQVLISAVPEKTVPEKWLNATSIQCDHCGHKRYRTHSILLRNVDTNEYKEVGSTCVKDFFGLDPKGFMYMAAIKFHNIVGGIKDEDCMRGGRKPWAYDLETVLSMTSAVIEKFGWTSKGYAYKYEIQSTSNRVWDNLEPYRGMPNDDFVHVSESNIELSKKVIEHFSNIDPNGNEYLTNLTKITKLGYVPAKFMGFACSMITSYEKAMEIKREREKVEADDRVSNFVGEIKERLKDIQVEVTYKRNIESDFGISTLYAFKDVDGNVYKTFYSGSSFSLETGDVVLLTGTVKKHQEYKGKKETMLSRIIVKDAPAEAFQAEEFAVA